MSDLHIDDFYRDAGRVLVQLYRTFPRRAAIYVEDISGPDQPDDYGLHSTRHLACLATMIWLADQAYLDYESTIRQEAIDQAVLSHKGFTLLSCQYQGEEATAASNIDCLRKALKSGSSTRVMNIMQHLLGISHRFQ